MEEAKFAALAEKRRKKQAKKDEKKRLKRQQESTAAHSSVKKPRSTISADVHSKPKPSSPSSSSCSRCWNFAVDYNDHFETPLVAYQDILPVLQNIADRKGKSLHDLVVYDPYYCKGEMVKHLKSLGINKVINENRDFYQQIRSNCIPEHDVLITNPPYSGEHKSKLLQYLLGRKLNPHGAIPFMLLLPAYTATKSYWKDFAETQVATAWKMQYYMPSSSYNFVHPEGTGKALPPFYSCWFIGTDYDISTSYRSKRDDQHDRTCCGKVIDSVEAMAELGYVSLQKRGNPKQRNRKKKSKQHQMDSPRQ